MNYKFIIKKNKSMKNKITLISFSILLSALFISCGSIDNGPPRVPPTPVTAYTVKPERASYYDDYPGTVTALNQVEIRPEVSGYLTDIYFEDGQHVTEGMKLYAIDQQQYKAAYDVAKANLDKAQRDYDTYSELAKNNAIAKQVLEHSLDDLNAAKSNLNAVETNLRNSIIYAPFSGTIGISQVKLGAAVTTGQTLMNTLSSDNPMAVDFAVDEKQINKFSELLNKKDKPKDSTFTIILPDQSQYPYPGHLLLLDRAVDPQTGTITARLTFSNPKNLLRPGLTCNVMVLNNNTSNSIVIPYKAVVVQMGEYFVFVINGNRAMQRRIEIGRTINNNMIIVNSGLKPDEQIVTQGVQKLRNNSPIVLNTENIKSSNQQRKTE
jgi:RND family efflux transporter MFP subunit